MQRLYLDEDSMDQALVRALRARGVDVMTAHEAGMIERSDRDHLQFATAEGRVLCTFNVGDFYELHSAYLAQSKTPPASSWCPNSATASASRCGDC